jgi:hypothetical protein
MIRRRVRSSILTRRMLPMPLQRERGKLPEGISTRRIDFVTAVNLPQTKLFVASLVLI